MNPVLIIACKRNINDIIKRITDRKVYISIEYGSNPLSGSAVLDLEDVIVKRNSFDMKSQHGWLSAIEWFFSNEEQGIVLEDDTIPNNSFFKFCDLMLEVGNNSNDKIYMVNGSNFLNQSENTFYKTKFASMWGWAGWRKRIAELDLNYSEKIVCPYRNRYFQNKFKKRTGLDYAFQYTIWKNNGWCLQSGKNLVTNIGLDEHAQHTKTGRFFKLFNLPSEEIDFNELTYDIKNHDSKMVKVKYPNKIQKLKNFYETIR